MNNLTSRESMLMDVIRLLRTSRQTVVEFNPDVIREDAHMLSNHDALRLTPGDECLAIASVVVAWVIGIVAVAYIFWGCPCGCPVGGICE